jgi:hypothetical protein
MRDYAAWQDAVGDTGKWSYNDLLPVFMAQEATAMLVDDLKRTYGALARAGGGAGSSFPPIAYPIQLQHSRSLGRRK